MGIQKYFLQYQPYFNWYRYHVSHSAMSVSGKVWVRKTLFVRYSTKFLEIQMKTVTKHEYFQIWHRFLIHSKYKNLIVSFINCLFPWLVGQKTKKSQNWHSYTYTYLFLEKCYKCLGAQENVLSVTPPSTVKLHPNSWSTSVIFLQQTNDSPNFIHTYSEFYLS